MWKGLTWQKSKIYNKKSVLYKLHFDFYTDLKECFAPTKKILDVRKTNK